MEAGDRVARDGPSWLPRGGWGAAAGSPAALGGDCAWVC